MGCKYANWKSVAGFSALIQS